MRSFKKFIALTAAALAVCLTFSSCTSQKEDNGVAYEKNMKISNAADLEGKAVAVQLRSAEDEFIVNNNLTAYPKRYSDMTKAVQDLIDKKVAAVVVDANYAKLLTEGVEGVKTVKGSIGSVDYRFLLSRSDEELAEKFNAQIAALKESEDYSSMTESELSKGVSYRVAKDSDKKLKKTLTFVAEPAFAPFIYQKDGEVCGLFAAAADGIAYGCGCKLDVKTVEPLAADDSASASEGSSAAFTNNEAQTVNTDKNAFCVVSAEAGSEDPEFITTDSFYTSQLVMIIRSSEK